MFCVNYNLQSNATTKNHTQDSVITVTFVKHTIWTGHGHVQKRNNFFSFFPLFLLICFSMQLQSLTQFRHHRNSRVFAARGEARAKQTWYWVSFGSACTVCDRASGARASARETDKILHCQTRNRRTKSNLSKRCGIRQQKNWV